MKLAHVFLGLLVLPTPRFICVSDNYMTVCERGYFACFKDCCMRKVYFCNEAEQRCTMCDSRSCGTGTEPRDCQLYCYLLPTTSHSAQSTTLSTTLSTAGSLDSPATDTIVLPKYGFILMCVATGFVVFGLVGCVILMKRKLARRAGKGDTELGNRTAQASSDSEKTSDGTVHGEGIPLLDPTQTITDFCRSSLVDGNSLRDEVNAVIRGTNNSAPEDVPSPLSAIDGGQQAGEAAISPSVLRKNDRLGHTDAQAINHQAIVSANSAQPARKLRQGASTLAGQPQNHHPTGTHEGSTVQPEHRNHSNESLHNLPSNDSPRALPTSDQLDNAVKVRPETDNNTVHSQRCYSQMPVSGNGHSDRIVLTTGIGNPVLYVCGDDASIPQTPSGIVIK